MRARVAKYAVALAPLIAAACAAPIDRVNGGFGTESPPGAVVVQAPQPPVVVHPGQPVVVQPPQPATVVVPASVIQAEDLEANEVRAQTIYANRIEAAEIRGAIHQTAEVRIDRSVADLRAPTVVAGVVYADTIKAHRVIADHIFVRDLTRR